eukprot:COSAG04_NODE_726_length_10783_cov_3.873081_3_plen_56_part_00
MGLQAAACRHGRPGPVLQSEALEGNGGTLRQVPSRLPPQARARGSSHTLGNFGGR